MGLIDDLLKEVPLSAVLRERVALAEQKHALAASENVELKKRLEALEQQNAELKAKVPSTQQNDLSPDTTRVLVHLFRARDDDCDVGVMASALGVERSLLQYHLDCLNALGFAHITGGNYVDGHTYWGLSPRGRKYAVENKLI